MSDCTPSASQRTNLRLAPEINCHSALPLLEENESESREKARVLERLGNVKKLVGEYDVCFLKYWNDGLLLVTFEESKKSEVEFRFV